VDKTVCDWVTVAGLEVLVLLVMTSVIIGEASLEVCVEDVVSELINRVDIEKKSGVKEAEV
jgi:hypothetical protein